jgi:hypothetical protein
MVKKVKVPELYLFVYLGYHHGYHHLLPIWYVEHLSSLWMSFEGEHHYVGWMDGRVCLFIIKFDKFTSIVYKMYFKYS